VIEKNLLYGYKWQKVLISQFPDSEYEISLDNLYILKLKNILNTKINLSDRYGFMTLEFPKYYVKDSFLKHINLNIKYEELGNNARNIIYDWDVDKFPCRIYPEASSTTISFYPALEVKNFENEKLINYQLEILQTIKMDILNFKGI
jgi:hypothetical protein